MSSFKVNRLKLKDWFSDKFECQTQTIIRLLSDQPLLTTGLMKSSKSLISERDGGRAREKKGEGERERAIGQSRNISFSQVFSVCLFV